MRWLSTTATLIAVAITVGLSAPASADVLYTFTYYNGGTDLGNGTLDLNLTSVSQADNLNKSLSGILVDVTTPNLDGTGTYTVTPADLASGSIDTGPQGQIYSLTVQEVEPSGDVTGKANILFLDLYTNSWQLHGQWDSEPYEGQFTVGLPTDPPAPVPEPLTLSVFGAGLGAVATIRRRNKSKLKAQ